MKLNISHDNQEIVNYINVQINDGSINLSNIIDNSCEEILLSNTLDHIPYDGIANTIMQIVKKLRFNGKLIIVGNDARMLNRLFLSDHISISDYNKIIQDIKSMNNVLNIRNILKQFNLQIDTESIKGYKYEIVATRTNI